MVVGERRGAPQAEAVGFGFAEVHRVGIAALDHRPCPSQRRAGLGQRFAQNAISSPVSGRLSVPVGFMLLVESRNAPERRVGNHKTRAAVRENVLVDLHFAAVVERLRGIEAFEPVQQVRPHQVRVRLDEDVPLLVRVQFERARRHREELPLVEPPAFVVDFARRAAFAADGAAEFRGVERLAAVGAQSAPEREVWVRVFEVVVDVGEDVVDFVAVEVFGVVGEDEGVGVAFEGCGEVGGEFVFDFGGAGAHYDEDIFAAVEFFAGKVFFFFVGCWGCYGCGLRCGLCCGVGCCKRFLSEVCWDLPVP